MTDEVIFQRLQDRPEVPAFSPNDFIPIVRGGSPLYRVSVQALAGRLRGLIGELTAAVTTVNGEAGDVTITPFSIDAIPTSFIGEPDGVAPLDSGGKLGTEFLPAAAITPLHTSGFPLALGNAAARGTSTQAARGDHVHPLPTPADIGAAVLTASGAPAALGSPSRGTGTTAARSDHVHAMPSAADVGAATPADLAAGLSGKSDTGHGHAGATPDAAGFMTGADRVKLDGIAAGATNTPLASAGVPAPLGTAARGTSTEAARRDHAHAMPSLAALGISTFAQSLLDDTSPDVARATLGIPLTVGPSAAVPGVRMSADWTLKVGGQDGTYEGGQWTGHVYAGVVLSKEFNSTHTSATEVPAPGFLSTAYANGSGPLIDVVAGHFIAVAMQANDCVFGGNIIAANKLGANNTKLVGLEVDQQFAPGTTPGDGSAGLYINTFGANNTGNAIMVYGHAGYWSNGIKLGGINPTSGAGLSLTGNDQYIGSLINTTVGNFTQAGVVLGNGRGAGVRIDGAGGGFGRIYGDGNYFVLSMLPSGLAIKSSDGFTTLDFFDTDGSIDIQGGGALKIGGVVVAQSRKSGWSKATGTANRTAFDTSTVSVTQLAQRVKALIDDAYDGMIGA